MPFYDYACEKCGYVWDVQHSIHEDPKYKCPECESNKVSKQFLTAPMMRAKGSDVVERMMKDKAGLERDRNLYTLEKNDPYAHMRPDGDKDVVKSRLLKAGKRNYDNDGNYTGKKFMINDKKKSKKKKNK